MLKKKMWDTMDLRDRSKSPESDWYDLDVTTEIMRHNHKKKLQVIDAALKNGDEKRDIYRQSCFGHFQRMQRGMKFSSVIIHCLLLRELHHDGPRDEMRFMLGPRTVRFSKVEFCLITGLKFGAIPDTALYEDVPNGIHHRYFRSRAAVTFYDIKARMKQGQWDNQSDAVKLCLLYMLNCVLIGADERNSVPIWQLRLVDDLDAFNAFPWGSLVYKHSILQHSTGFKIPRATTYNIFGLAYALQVFAFEVIPTLATNFATRRVVEQPLPRILKWDFTKRPRRDKLEKIFTADMIAEEELVPTEAERVIWYYQGIDEVAAAASIPKKRPTNEPGNDASRKKHKPESAHSLVGELEKRTSNDVISEAKDPALEPEIAKLDAIDGSLAAGAEQQTINDLAGTSNGRTMISRDKVDLGEVQAAASYPTKATESCFGKMATPDNEASKKKHESESVHSLGGELENHASHAVEPDARIQDNEAKDPALEPTIAQIDAIDDSLVAELQTISHQLAASYHVPGISESQDSTKASESRFDKMATSFLEMLEDDKDPSSLSLRDFKDISSNNLVDVGFFAVPPSLVSYAKDLLANHPDIGNGKDQSPLMNEMAFVVLCCVLKSMDTTHLNELTKSLILKWRDAIRCALQSGFKVDFLMDHLKFVARAYLAELARNSNDDKELLAIDEKMRSMNEELVTLKAQRAEMYKNVSSELRKICEAAAEKFPGETFGSFSM